VQNVDARTRTTNNGEVFAFWFVHAQNKPQRKKNRTHPNRPDRPTAVLFFPLWFILHAGRIIYA
jgi:hypothetical protein